MTDRRQWRPEPWWIPAGLLLGAASGVVVGALWGVFLFALTGQLLAGLVVGGVFGLLYGGFVGLLVGCLLAVLVGRDRPVREARRTATLAGLLATPTVLVGVLVLNRTAVDGWSAPLLVMAAAAGGLTCRWVAGRMPLRPRVVPGSRAPADG